MSLLSSQVTIEDYDFHGMKMRELSTDHVALDLGHTCHQRMVATEDDHQDREQCLLERKPAPAEHIPFILLVEDNADVRLILRTMLTYKGFRVETAVDGQEAVEKANMDQHDLIVMDLQMPRMDGFEALTRLRHQGYVRPIIALTAHASMHDRSRCLACGFSEFMTKPVDTRVLHETLQRLIASTT